MNVPGKAYTALLVSLVSLVSLALAATAPAMAGAAEDETVLVTRADGADGAPSDDGVYQSEMSANGRYAVFSTWATNLVPESTDGQLAVYRRDILLGKTTLISRASGLDGAAANTIAENPGISADGRYVVFLSSARNLTGATGNSQQVYVRDTAENTTTLVSRASGLLGAQADSGANYPEISDDGRHVAFTSFSGNLVPGVPDRGNPRVYQRDLLTGVTQLVDTLPADAGPGAVGAALGEDISADGGEAVFLSYSGAYPNACGECAYFRRLPDGPVELVSRPTIWPAGGDERGTRSTHPVISGDGEHVAFGGTGNKIDPLAGSNEHIAVRDVSTAQTEIVTRASGPRGAYGAPLNTAAGHLLGFRPYDLSADGRYVAFSSYSPNLDVTPRTAPTAVYVRDRVTQTTTLVSRASGQFGEPSSATASSPQISADGQTVMFKSSATNLVPDVPYPFGQLYVRTNWSQDPPPILAAVPDQTVMAGKTLRVQLEGSDPEGDELTYEASALPAGATLAAATGELSWTPSDAGVGVHTGIKARVKDRSAIDERSFTITVLPGDPGPGDPGDPGDPVNHAPTIAPIAPRAVNVGDVVVIHPTATDPDEGTTLTWGVQGMPGGAVVDPATGGFAWIPSPGQTGVTNLRFVVSDGALYGVRETTVTVSAGFTNPPSGERSPEVVRTPGATVPRNRARKACKRLRGKQRRKCLRRFASR